MHRPQTLSVPISTRAGIETALRGATSGISQRAWCWPSSLSTVGKVIEIAVPD